MLQRHHINKVSKDGKEWREPVVSCGRSAGLTQHCRPHRLARCPLGKITWFHMVWRKLLQHSEGWRGCRGWPGWGLGGVLPTVLCVGTFQTRESYLGKCLQRGLDSEPKTAPGDMRCWVISQSNRLAVKYQILKHKNESQHVLKSCPVPPGLLPTCVQWLL